MDKGLDGSAGGGGMSEEAQVSIREEEGIVMRAMKAYEKGKGREESNPYPPENERHGLWNHGWDTAFELDAMEEE